MESAPVDGTTEEDGDESEDSDDYSTLDDKPSPVVNKATDQFYSKYQKHRKINYAEQLEGKAKDVDESTIFYVFHELTNIMPRLTTECWAKEVQKDEDH